MPCVLIFIIKEIFVRSSASAVAFQEDYGFGSGRNPNVEGLRDLESHVAMLRILGIACCDLEVQRSPEVWTGAKRMKRGALGLCVGMRQDLLRY